MEYIGWLILLLPFVFILRMLKKRQSDDDRPYGPQDQGGVGPAQGMPPPGS